MRFVETTLFTKQVTALLADDEYRRLQSALVLHPEAGPVIVGSGGIRKVRWARPGSGKRGGLRVIYYWAPDEMVLYMLLVYAKNVQDDLTAEQVAVLRRIVREEFK
jgi:hypothetical protein